MSSKIKVDLLLHNVDIVVSSGLTFTVSYEIHCFEGLKDNNKLATAGILNYIKCAVLKPRSRCNR